MPHTTTDAELAASLDGGFTSATADLDGVRLHYVIGGQGSPLVLLGGWPQTWWQFHKVMPELARHRTVIAVDIRGQGGSSRPESGYDKKTMAGDIRAVLHRLGHESAAVVGHDIGGMVAHALAAVHPEAVDRLVLLDVPHPDERFNSMPLLPAPGQRPNISGREQHAGTMYLWWFAFNQVQGLPERLLAGRERTLVDWLVGYMLYDEASIDERSREVYARALADPDAIRAGNAWYQAFPQDIADQKGYPRLRQQVLGLSSAVNLDLMRGALADQVEAPTVVEVPRSGHYLPEEQPEFVTEQILAFLR